MGKWRNRTYTKNLTDPEVHIISGKISCDHVHMFISYKPQISLSKLVVNL
ncbi:transposase [Rickettsia sp. MEAM1 (Bemisia tabaci)]|nr:transposase [Rickettsia sp. MEAM1 (Bemisia tabaci)]